MRKYILLQEVVIGTNIIRIRNYMTPELRTSVHTRENLPWSGTSRIRKYLVKKLRSDEIY